METRNNTIITREKDDTWKLTLKYASGSITKKGFNTYEDAEQYMVKLTGRKLRK